MKHNGPIYEALREQIDSGEITNRNFNVGGFLHGLNDYNLSKLFSGADSVLRHPKGDVSCDLACQVVDIARLVYRIETDKPMNSEMPDTFWRYASVFAIIIMLEHCRREGMVRYGDVATLTNSILKVEWTPETKGNALRQFIIDASSRLASMTIQIVSQDDKWLGELMDMLKKKYYQPTYSLSVYLTLISDKTLAEMVEAAKRALRQLKERETKDDVEPEMETMRLAALAHLVTMIEKGKPLVGAMPEGIDTNKLARFCALLIMEQLSRKKLLKFHGGIFLTGSDFAIEMNKEAVDVITECITSLKLECFDFTIADQKSA